MGGSVVVACGVACFRAYQRQGQIAANDLGALKCVLVLEEVQLLQHLANALIGGTGNADDDQRERLSSPQHGSGKSTKPPREDSFYYTLYIGIRESQLIERTRLQL